MSKIDEAKKKFFSDTFDDMFSLGMNPLAAGFTTCDDTQELYKEYATDRLASVKAGLDPVYKFTRVAFDKLDKISK